MMKKKNPNRWLLMIPIQILIDVILFYFAVWIDTAVLPNPNALGHPAPAVTILALLLIPIFTIIVIIIAIILTLISNAKVSKENTYDAAKTEAERIHDDEMKKVDYYLQYVLRPTTPLDKCRKHFEDFSIEADEKIYYHIMGNGNFNEIAKLLWAVIEEKRK